MSGPNLLAHAAWIWYEKYFNLINTYMQARRSFTLTRVPADAHINITADARYRLWVNGTHVMRGPARGFQVSWPYDTVDIAPFLRRGKNAIAVLVHNPGISNFQYIHEGSAGLLVWGRAGDVIVNTGPEWKVRPAPGYRPHTARLSKQLGWQEHVDMRAVDWSWLKPATSDRDWRTPTQRVSGAMPWHSLEERGIPPLREEPAFPVTAVSAAAELENSLRVLRTDHVDLYQMHAVTTTAEVERILGAGGALEAFVTARAAGKTRFLGFSAHSEEAALMLMAGFPFDSVLFPWNWATWFGNGFGRRVLAGARSRGMGLLALKALARRQWKADESRRRPKAGTRPLKTRPKPPWPCASPSVSA
ncbi:MAG: aldo/keto reductase [Planctomycetota bacterium]